MKEKKEIIHRKAGILLHITSLPGKFLIGDFGPEAYHFVNFLERSGQTYWQILPLNPIDKNWAYSPYSPLSAFAGNTLLISPELLADKGLISKPLSSAYSKNSNRVNYIKAELFKQKIIDEAYARFCEFKSSSLQKEFEEFCDMEKYWLDDYALFITIRKQNNNSSWDKWPTELKERFEEALTRFQIQHAVHIEHEKFAQFLFMQQWKALRKFSNDKGIKIFGDLPIYVSHDSADVWIHPYYFKLKENKEIDVMAGVPPDYFNKNGQLWRMPIYNWDNLKKDGYDWWVKRMKKNLQLIDLMRIDHFRGFSSYWEVPANMETAKEGKWIKGPGKDLFDVLKKKLPEMPFVAEDLGEVDQSVYKLRDKYNLPGIRILQFSFEKDMPYSIHTPHNYNQNSVVYTGTHDNNTVKGWYKNELGKKGRKNLQYYLGKKVNSRTCPKELIRFAYKSISCLAIIPMQDILGLGKAARMNIPSVEKGNWRWRLRKRKRTRTEKELKKLVESFGRK
jgi:4-alpha-glucanotransferase